MDSDPYTPSSLTGNGHVKYMSTPFFVTICDAQRTGHSIWGILPTYPEKWLNWPEIEFYAYLTAYEQKITLKEIGKW